MRDVLPTLLPGQEGETERCEGEKRRDEGNKQRGGNKTHPESPSRIILTDNLWAPGRL